MSLRHTLLILLLQQIFVCLPHSQLQRKAGEEMSVEWMFGGMPERIATVPSVEWLADGRALIYDTRRPEAERTFEYLDPESGRRSPALDMHRAIASFRSFLGENDSTVALPWPLMFDAAGTRALYTFSGDLYVLDLGTAGFRRVTRTDPTESAATLSPDGTLVAYTRDNDLFVYDLRGGVEKRLTNSGSSTMLNGTFSWVYWEEVFGHSNVGYWWSGDSRSIAFLQTDESPVNTMTFTDFEPYQPRVLVQRYPKAGTRTPVVHLGIVSVGTGGITWMKLPTSAYEYIVRVGWLPDNARVSVQTLNRAQTELRLYLVSAADGSAANILTETDDAWMHFYTPYFWKDAKSFLWVSERTGYAHLYRYTIDGRLIDRVTSGEWSLRPYGAFAIYDDSPLVAVDEHQGWIYFTAGEKSTRERHLYRVRPDGTRMVRLSTEDGYHRVRFSRNSSFYTDTYSNVSTPPSLTLHRADGTPVTLLAGPQSSLLAQFDMRYPKFLTIPAADGFPLPAQLSTPSNFNQNRKYPVILYVYGGPGSPSVSNAWNANDWSQSIYFDQVLLRSGYCVMSVDNRSSASVGKILEKRIRGQMYGDVELHDLEAAVRWIKSQTYVDSNRVGIWGWSGGGMYTLLGLTRTREFRAGIAVAPVTDWHYYDAKWTELIMKRPEDNPEGYTNTSLVRRAADLHGRLLLVYGTHDDNVHPQNSQAFMNALIAAGKSFDLMVYPMRQHLLADAPARIHLFHTMVEYWRRCL